MDSVTGAVRPVCLEGETSSQLVRRGRIPQHRAGGGARDGEIFRGGFNRGDRGADAKGGGSVFRGQPAGLAENVPLSLAAVSPSPVASKRRCSDRLVSGFGGDTHGRPPGAGLDPSWTVILLRETPRHWPCLR